MRIKEIKKRMNNDFWAVYECEHCGYITDEIAGYDDVNFHKNVIPNMECKKCGLKSGGDTG
jgi:rubredoxin